MTELNDKGRKIQALAANYWVYILIYIVLAAGVLWNYLGIFQTVMQAGSSLMPASLALLLLWDALGDIESGTERRHFMLWCALVFAGGMAVEIIGVATGMPFGEYYYTDTMQPQLLGVPYNIGFSWFGVLLSARGAYNSLRRTNSVLSVVHFALAVGIGMTLFDIVMEPAAITLQYWVWNAANPPLLNYTAWLVLGVFFAGIGGVLSPSLRKPPSSPLATHVFFAQILFFVLTTLFL